jgi:recombination protein RecT
METKTTETAKKPEDKKNGTNLAKKELSQSERFTQAVIKQFTDTAGELKLTNFQRKLCQNYFIKLDQQLKDAEQKRLAKAEKYRESLEFKWNNVNMDKLAVDVVAFSGVGLDPTQPNHINMIPYKSETKNLFNIGFIVGYKGKEIKARKYGLEIPDDVVVELVYQKDVFKQFKKDLNNRVETYQFEVTDNFDRGPLVRGFYYHVYYKQPEKNKLRVFSKSDIDKRKPAYASPEFWGGEKDKWEYDSEKGKNVKKGKEVVEGWYDEMAYKTVYSAAWGGITIDSQKIDDAYVQVMQKEKEPIDARVLKEINENANRGEAIGFEEERTEAIEPVTQPLSVEEASQEQIEETSDNEGNGPGY